MIPLEREDLVHALAAAIDADEPPGLAANKLARTIVQLVENRESPEAALLERDLEVLVNRYRRQPVDVPTRYCTSCNFLHPDDPPVVARYVAESADGSEWYECGQHPPTDNAAQRLRVKLTDLDLWRRDNGLLREASGAKPQ